jgi:hypothetical protein
MSCYYCHKQGWDHIPDAGTCAVCAKAVCVRPPFRSDGEAHADQCSCGCEMLVCDPHMIRHSREAHNSDHSSCFPTVGLAAADSVLRVAGSLLANQGPTDLKIDDHQIRAMTRLLTVVTPGAALFAQVFPGHPTASWSWDRDTLAHTGEALIRFQSPFFTRPVVTGIFALAARTAGACWRSLRTGVDHIRPRVPRALGLDALASWEASREELRPEAILPLLRLPTHPMLSDIAAAVNRLDLPYEPEQIAEWFYRTDRGTVKEFAIADPSGLATGGTSLPATVGAGEPATRGETEDT